MHARGGLHTETQIGKSGNHWFYYEVNPFYVDVLDKKVISAFIEKIYEPQITREGIPWSFVFEEEYRNRYQDDIKNHLEELFINQGDYVTTRFRFWKMVTDLFSSAYMKQIYDWCEQHNLKLTGHL